MKLIIAGGRDYKFDAQDRMFLDNLRGRQASLSDPIEEVITGGAPGADTCGYIWAVESRLPTKTFRAAWKMYGNAAGPIRNREMAQHCGKDGILVLFPGGKGTASMRREAQSVGMKILEPKP